MRVQLPSTKKKMMYSVGWLHCHLKLLKIQYNIKEMVNV